MLEFVYFCLTIGSGTSVFSLACEFLNSLKNPDSLDYASTKPMQLAPIFWLELIGERINNQNTEIILAYGIYTR